MHWLARMAVQKIFLVLIALVVSTSWARISGAEIASHSAKGLRLISLSEGVDPVWMTEDEKLELMVADTNFFDVTETYDPNEGRAANRAPAVIYPPPSRQSEVRPLIQKVSLPSSQQYLANLTAFNTRFYRAETGAASSKWLRDTILQARESSIASNFPTSGASASLFNHSFVQSSVIAKIPGKTSNAPVTILGAHLDSINGGSPTSGRAPGADDDGSGCVNLLEAFRVLVSSGFKPSTPVEFHWYAGEEAGLLGSRDIVKSYKSSNVQVKAMLHFDMTAYYRPGSKEVITLVPDYADSGLNTFVGSLINNYLNLTWVTGDPCGYACSDHASWYQQGYPTAYPFESLDRDMNPVYHSTSDTSTLSGFSWSHLLEFTKLAVGFAYELAA